jgi:hypothetical protein
MVSGFGHEEKDQKTHENEASSHAIIQCAETIVLIN